MYHRKFTKGQPGNKQTNRGKKYIRNVRGEGLVCGEGYSPAGITGHRDQFLPHGWDLNVEGNDVGTMTHQHFVGTYRGMKETIDKG